MIVYARVREHLSACARAHAFNVRQVVILLPPCCMRQPPPRSLALATSSFAAVRAAPSLASLAGLSAVAPAVPAASLRLSSSMAGASAAAGVPSASFSSKPSAAAGAEKKKVTPLSFGVVTKVKVSGRRAACDGVARTRHSTGRARARAPRPQSLHALYPPPPPSLLDSSLSRTAWHSLATLALRRSASSCSSCRRRRA